MKSFRTLLTLLLVALWPLVTSHCSLEQLPGLEFLACDIESPATPHQNDSCENTCTSVESGFYKTEDGQQVVPAPPLSPSAFLTAFMLEAAQPAASQSMACDSAPPELPKVWHFTFRTALPPRAPSFVS